VVMAAGRCTGSLVTSASPCARHCPWQSRGGCRLAQCQCEILRMRNTRSTPMTR
jgi:hypothetical protein